MTDRADTFYVPFIYLPCSFISEIHESYATKISVLERNLSGLRREKEAEVQNSRANKNRKQIKHPSDGNSAKKVGTKPAFDGLTLKSVQQHFPDSKKNPQQGHMTATKLAPPLEQHKNEPCTNKKRQGIKRPSDGTSAKKVGTKPAFNRGSHSGANKKRQARMMDMRLNESILLGQIERLKSERIRILQANELWLSHPDNPNPVNYEKGESC